MKYNNEALERIVELMDDNSLRSEVLEIFTVTELLDEVYSRGYCTNIDQYDDSAIQDEFESRGLESTGDTRNECEIKDMADRIVSEINIYNRPVGNDVRSLLEFITGKIITKEIKL